METSDYDKKRTVVVSGVPVVLPASRMVDKLTIHFQNRRRSHGGDVERVQYPTDIDGVAFVIFDLAADAVRVVQKEQQIMADEEFPDDYVLNVFPFTRDVFFYVSSATVDLSIFGSDQALLIQSLQSAYRSIRFKPLLHQRKATIEGPFAAIQALREDLICRASRLKPIFSAQTAAAKLRESPPETKVISHHECVSPVSCSGSKAKLELPSSNSLLARSQTTSEAFQIKNLLTNTTNPKHSVQQKVSRENFPVGSLYNTDNIKEVRTAQSSTHLPREYRTEQSKASLSRMFAGFKSSGLDLLPAQQISAKHPKVDSVSQKLTRPDRNSATKFKGKIHLGSCHSNIDFLKE